MLLYKKYYKHFIKNIKNKYYYTFYCLSMFVSYLFVILSGMYFVNLAFDDSIISKDNSVLCFTCIEYNKSLINILSFIFLLNIIFYLLNEIRFRIIKFKKIRKIDHGNEITYLLTVLILITLYILI